MTTDRIRQSLKTATSLEALRDILNGLDDTARGELGNDFGDLPTFGGLDPVNTDGMWSWDVNNVLTGTGPFAVEDRSKVRLGKHDFDFDGVVELMDDAICEILNADLAPCSKQDFVDAYVVAHREKFGEEFSIS